MLQKQIAQKSSNRKSKLVLSSYAGHYTAFKQCISFATNLAANFGCNLSFRITPDIVSKLLRAAI